MRVDGLSLKSIFQPAFTKELESQILLFGIIPLMVSTKARKSIGTGYGFS